MRPELERPRDDSIPAPEVRQRDGAVPESRFGLRVAGVQLRPALYQLGLWRYPRGDPAASRPALPVGCGDLGLDLLDVSFDPDLPAELRPVEDERRPGVLGELRSLARPPVREEEEPALVEPPQQHHSGGWAARCGRCRQRHRLGERCALGLSQPVSKRGDRFGVQILEVHRFLVTLCHKEASGERACAVRRAA